MELPGHIIDLVCSLGEQAMGDNDIIRWCIRLMDKPREASTVTVFLESADRSPEDISNAFTGYD